MITYLYHKRHKITGLNYFGKTTTNPYKYNGSGKYWNHHLKKHGKEIETIQVWSFENINECSNFAIEFSLKHNIVESNEWANLCIEDGLAGGNKFKDMSNEEKKTYSKEHSQRIKEIWKTRSKEELSTKISEVWKTRSNKAEISSKISNTLLSKTPEEKEATLQKYRDTVKQRKKITCPYCNIIGTNISNMNRYHFDRCLLNPDAVPRKPRMKLICEHCQKETDPGNFKKLHGDRCKFKLPPLGDNFIS